jgi:uncharacterized membrane protein YagU involved in acid resistance
MNERGVGTALLGDGLGARVSRGAVAGIAAGLLFLLANMGWATKSGMPGVAPLIDMATIFNVTDKPDPTAENISIGLITHLNLSMLFGIGFALLVPLLRDARTLALAAAGYGLALYLVNFQILGRTVFPWFQEGPDQVFEVFAHLGYGLLLVPFMVGLNASTATTGERVAAARRADSRRQVLTPAGRSS